MRRRRIPRLGTPRLDFVVIGAQKAGTTALWRYLEDNPGLRLPPHKEAAFFSEPEYPAGLRSYMRALFRDAPARAKLGTVTPTYMLGSPGAPPPVIAERIAATFPDTKLVALLRDPVERAASHHRMSVRRGVDERSFEEAVAEALTPDALERSRSRPTPTNTYVTAGEYGRILAAYVERFGRDQLHVEPSAGLERDPGPVVRRVCEFVGVRPHEPRRLGERFHVSGSRPRIDPDGAAELKDHLRRNAWSRMRHPEQHEHWFNSWFDDIWNVQPQGPAEPVPERTARRLHEHFAPDARLLEEATGFKAAWLNSR
jgi:hypothetical protein